MTNKNTRRLLAGLALCAMVPLASASDPRKPLSIQGNLAPPACVPKQLKALKEQLFKVVHTNPESAWEATYALLCGKGKKYERIALAHMPGKILTVDDSPDFGEKGPLKTLEPASTKFMARGYAWDVSLYEKSDDNEFWISYSPDEACSSGRKFRRLGTAWLLIEVPEACD